eukprot:Em0017g719a
MEITVVQCVIEAAMELGYSSMKPEQAEVAVALIVGRDVFAILPTGFGKSLCYACLPVAFDKCQKKERGYSIVVVVSPLVAVMKDQSGDWFLSDKSQLQLLNSTHTPEGPWLVKAMKQYYISHSNIVFGGFTCKRLLHMPSAKRHKYQPGCKKVAVSLSLRVFTLYKWWQAAGSSSVGYCTDRAARETANMGETSEAIAAMQELFRNLLNERKKREEEEAGRREQERLEREEERKRLEAQWERERQEHIAEKERERQRREEDLRTRDQELRAQMELFAKMVESKKAESSSGASSSTADGELRVVKLADRDDIEAYLTTFERLMSAYNIPKDRWIFKLAPQLSAILRRYDITEETYRQRFREITKNVVESHRDVSIRLGDQANKWLKGLTTVEQVKEAIVLEQLLYTLGPSVRVWVKERKPKTALEAGQLPDDYSEARKQTAKESRPGVDLASPASSEKPTRHDQEQPDKEEGDKRSAKERHYSRSGYRNKDHHSHVTCYNCALQKAGVVEGQMVEDIVLDTGCSKTLIHHALVPRKKMLQGEAVTIRCAHGDNALYPLAMVDLVVDGVPLTVEAAVSKTLPVSVLLGTDVPELVRFLRTDSKDSRNFGGCEALMMVTRAGAKKREAEKEIQRQKEEESEVRPTPIASELAEEVQREEELPIESQKRMQRRQHQRDIPVGALDMSAVELQKLQETDPSLALPTQCPHLGKNKTAKRILRRFYWPTLYRDVEEFCECCRICQKASRLKGSKAPLIPLPIVTEPFRRVAMDIVETLPRTKSGNRYILVMSDYATRYPEAVPVKAIDVEHIAEELVKIFARVGIPEEILTDLGSNFTSQLLAEIYQLLHVHPIRTTPYHPQTDGLVERFNKTLKEMLRKVAADDGANWDKWVPYLLFAYREVPQDSTDILKESWKEPNKCGDNVVSYVLAMQDKLATMAEMVKGNLERAQQKQKLCSLTAQWKGPYPVLHKASSVNYVVDMHDTRKRERTFHINMLKKWNTPTYGNYWADVDDEESSENDIPEWRCSEKGEPTVGDQLSAVQKSQLNKVLETFSDVMSSIPGRTTEMEHQVTTTGTRPGAPATFQRLMDKVLQGLEDYAAAYIDDLVIHSTTWEEHLTQIQTVFQRLRLAGLTAKPQKCQLGMSRCVYLGHVVGSGLVQPERSKMQGVESFPTPTTKKQVRCFLGMTGYYRKFIPDYASIAAPLTDLTKNAAPNQVVWTDRCEGSFQKLKSLLCREPVLRSPDFTKEFVLQTDASDVGVGAVLSQLDEERADHPVAYYSRKLLAREQKCATIEKECLAIKLAHRHLEYICWEDPS